MHLTDWKVCFKLSTMESRESDAHVHLEQYQVAAAAAGDENLAPSHKFYVLLAFIGPALILGSAGFAPETFDEFGVDRLQFEQSSITIFRVLAVLFAAISVVAMVAEWLRDRRRAVRVLAPIRGGRYSPWLFAYTFSSVLGVAIPLNLLNINKLNPVPLAVCSYLWLALVPVYLYRRHLTVLRNQ